MTRGSIPSGDARTYTQVGMTLLGGLITSIAVMVAGLLVAGVQGGSSTSHVLPLDQVITHLLKFESAAILDLGILLLFATPLAGVAVALVNFLIERDTTFAAVTLFLLAMLAVAFAVALH